MGTWLRYVSYVMYLKCLVINSVLSYWSYEDTTKWDKKWKICAGNHQSPLNIIDSAAATLPSHVALSFHSFATPVKCDLTNNGKTAKLTISSGANASVTGSRLYINNTYKLEEVHFHWGSEHRINGKTASMEVHLVNYNSMYTSFDAAKKESDGVLVLAVLVDVSTDVSLNSFWNDFTDSLADVQKPGLGTTVENVRLVNFLPTSKDVFYLYKGSFTTPPCFETVTWVIFERHLLMPQEYLERFKALMTNGGNGSLVRLATNNREVKPLNSRTVLKTFSTPAGNDGKNYVHETVFDGMDVIGVLTFYQCHVPSSVTLSIIIPSLEIAWKSSNTTSDIQEPRAITKSYSVTLEMHDHPKGEYKGNVHVFVKLNGADIIGNYYNLSKVCLRASKSRKNYEGPVHTTYSKVKSMPVLDSCFWSSVSSRTCSRKLINTDENLLFVLTRQNQCDDAYEIAIKKGDSILFDATMLAKSRIKVTPRKEDKKLNDILRGWYLFLSVDIENKKSRAKLSLDVPSSSLSSHGILVEGLYDDDPTCHNSHSGGTPDHVKLIIGVTAGLFILVMVILTVCLVCRNAKKSSKPNILIQDDELDTAV